MIIVLLEVSVILLPKATVGLGCLLKICLQISEFLQECIDLCLTWLIAMILAYLGVIYLKIAFNIRWEIFSANEFASSNPGVLRLLTELKINIFEISAFLISYVKIWSPSKRVIFLRLCFIRKQQHNNFSKLFIIVNILPVYN